jgi:hypothetical protein
LALVGHAVDVGEIGPLHAEMLCRLVHALGERLLTAGDPLGDHDGNVVGRLDDEDLERDEAVMQDAMGGTDEVDTIVSFLPFCGFALSHRSHHAGYQQSSTTEKIMTVVYALAVIAITFALAGCAPNIDKARAEYCKNLGAYAKTVAAVGALGPDSTVSDFKKAEKDEQEAYKKLTKAAYRLSEAQDAAIRKVKESFETVNDIKGSEKLGAAATTVQQATAQALSQYKLASLFRVRPGLKTVVRWGLP